MDPLFYVVRHGDTKLNDDGKFRGFIDVPLNERGKKEASDLADFFRDKKVGSIHSSDLSRSLDTARIIADAHSMPVLPSANLRPWDVGDLAGQSKTENAHVIESHVKAPNKQLPGGESLNEFRDRFGSKLRHITRNSAHPAVVVVHASNAHEVAHMVEGDPDAGDIKPGGVIAVYGTENPTMKVIRGAQANAQGWKTS